MGGLSYETSKGINNYNGFVTYNVSYSSLYFCVLTRKNSLLQAAVASEFFSVFLLEGLKNYFSQFGEVVGVDIKFDAVTGRPR